MRKNVLLLFSKLPEPGMVKTRLTYLKDGIFTPEDASVLFHCMLFDVVETCMAAFGKLEGPNASNTATHAQNVQDEYLLVISTAPAKNVSAMEALFHDAGEWPREIKFIGDKGATFDEHYNDAFNQVWDMGADCILSMGADMPALTVADVTRGFEALHRLDSERRKGIVLAPDQEMGVSIVGWTRNTEFNHTGVFYNPSGLTVLPAYVDKARGAELEAIYLPPVCDVDTMADLMHNVTLIEALNYCAQYDNTPGPWRTANALHELGFDEVRIPPNDLMDPRETIDEG